jgi:hypothetical protein
VPNDPRAAGPGSSKRPPYIVQFRKPLTAEDRLRLQGEYGLRLTDYVPELSYLEQLDQAVVRKLAADPLVRAVVPYDPALKLSPTIGTIRFRTPERAELKGLWLSIALFADADVSEVVETAKELAATDERLSVHDDREIGGGIVVTCVVPDLAAAERIASLYSVRSIEEVPEHIEDNSAAAATDQSGAANNPVIWNQGLHGESQVIGIIDSGNLDINHCFFQDPVDNTPGLTHRKVLEIRNAAGTANSDHASFTSGCAAGDDFNNPGASAQRGGAWAARLVSGNNGDIPGIASMLAELNPPQPWAPRSTPIAGTTTRPAPATRRPTTRPRSMSTRSHGTTRTTSFSGPRETSARSRARQARRRTRSASAPPKPTRTK